MRNRTEDQEEKPLDAFIRSEARLENRKAAFRGQGKTGDAFKPKRGRFFGAETTFFKRVLAPLTRRLSSDGSRRRSLTFHRFKTKRLCPFLPSPSSSRSGHLAAFRRLGSSATRPRGLLPARPGLQNTRPVAPQRGGSTGITLREAWAARSPPPLRRSAGLALALAPATPPPNACLPACLGPGAGSARPPRS